MFSSISSFTSPEARSVGRDARGFALVLTVALLAFLVLLLVSLSAIARVETQVAGNAQQLAEARQNALMALNIALGQLQKHAGPDQRVTAAADVLANYPDHPALPTSPVGNADAQTQIDGFWSDRRNRHWTGVWKNGNATAYNAAEPAAFNASPELQAWLVSGNEQGTTIFRPDGRVDALASGATALDEIVDASGRVHRLLVGPGSTAIVDPAKDLHRYVTAPQMEIKSSGVPGMGDTVTTGHYAWWVGDEGVKARANLRDPYADDTGEPVLVRNRKRLQSAQRVAIEAMATNPDGTGGLVAYPANDPGLANVFSARQLGFLAANEDFRTELRNHFHDLTTASRGVLTDVRHGGLKHDLSYILSRSTLPEFRAALSAALPGSVPSGGYNPILSVASTPYAEIPGADLAGMLDYSATWEQLWSYHGMGSSAGVASGGVFTPAGEAVPRVHSGNQHGIYPLLVQAKVFYRLRNRGGTVRVDVIPSVVLANPYSVPLAPVDYRFEVSGVPLLFQTSIGKHTDTSFPANTGVPLSNAGLQNAIIVVRPKEPIPAGEARAFSVSATENQIVSDANYDYVELAGDGSGQTVIMTEGHEEFQTCLSFDTGVALAPPASSGAPGQKARLKIAGNSAAPGRAFSLFFGNSTALSSIAHQGRAVHSSSGKLNDKVMVSPLYHDAAELKGGGILFAYFDGTKQSPNPWQQAPFYQLNYRALLNEPHSQIDRPFAVSEATYKEVKTVTAGANTWQWVNAFLNSSDPEWKRVRWGLAFRGTAAGPVGALTGAPSGFEDGAPYSSYRAFLYDVPRPGHPVISLGQLQHFNTSGHIPPAVTAIAEINTAHAWQVNYPIGNSYPHHRIDPELVMDRSFTTDDGKNTWDGGCNYDGSFLWNDVLWDRFTFSSYPGHGSFDFATDMLANARYRPFRDRSDVAWNEETGFRAHSRSAAKNLMVEGAFNINSTSVPAWKALFSALKHVAIGTESDASAPFVRTLGQTGGSQDAADGVTTNAWTGFRDLKSEEIDQLASEMVMQVRKRGPFLSMADFVNRRLRVASGDVYQTRLAGALQAAIDSVINQEPVSGKTRVTDVGAYKFSEQTQTATQQFADQGYVLPSRIAGFPGYLLQGDVLSSLAPTLTARSDTFTVRTYGDVVNPVTTDPATGKAVVVARAWCEAVVQRTPDYVVSKAAGGNDPEETPAAGSTNEAFGRRFQIVSFRWLNPQDI